MHNLLCKITHWPGRSRAKALFCPLLAFVFWFPGAGACNRRQSAETEHPPDSQLHSKPGEPSRNPPADHGAVKAEFHNVMFHLTPTAAAHLEAVSGELWPAGKYDMPVFDDKTSFEVHVASGTVSIAPDALAEVMNEHVFAGHGAPMKDISIKIKEDRLVIKGKLHSKGDLPFETGGELGVNRDGRLRLHSEKVKALHVPVKKAMSLFGIELANMINTSKIPGMETDKNDLLLDLGELLPPPHIRGEITAARLERNAIIVVYGNGASPAAAAERTPGNGAKAAGGAPPSGNYMVFRGNRVRFGKLTMENTDLAVLDLDPRDPLDWDQDSYQEQLVAGYTKTTNEFGLRAYVKDFAKLAKSARGAEPAKTAQRAP